MWRKYRLLAPTSGLNFTVAPSVAPSSLSSSPPSSTYATESLSMTMAAAADARKLPLDSGKDRRGKAKTSVLLERRLFTDDDDEEEEEEEEDNVETNIEKKKTQESENINSNSSSSTNNNNGHQNKQGSEGTYQSATLESDALRACGFPENAHDRQGRSSWHFFAAGCAENGTRRRALDFSFAEDEGECDDDDEEEEEEESDEEEEDEDDDDESCFLRGNSVETQRSRLSRLSNDARRSMVSLDKSLANAVLVASWQSIQ